MLRDEEVHLSIEVNFFAMDQRTQRNVMEQRA